MNVSNPDENWDAHSPPDFFKKLATPQLLSLFNHLPGVFFVVKDRTGRVVMANAVATRLCGMGCEAEMVGKTDSELFSPERAEGYMLDDRHVFETGESIIDRVEMAPDPNHSINWFVTTKIPLYSHGGEIVGLACIARNMTDAYEKLRPYAEMNEVLEFVRANHARPIKLEELATIAHLSPSQFERRFKKVFHISPMKHLLNVRVRAACNLLSSTHQTIASIAQDAGFYDHSHLDRNFKKIMKCSPGEYRAQGRKAQW